MIRYSLKQLRYFLSAAELKSTSEAARVLHVSQPSISTAISQLEAIFERPLLFRQQGQGVSPTPFGREMMRKTRALLEQAEGLHRDASEVPGGSVTIGCFADLSPYYLPGILRLLSDRWPAVEPVVVDGDFDSLPQALERGEIDLAITFDIALSPQLHKQALAEVQPHALIAADHVLARHRRVPIALLLREPFVVADLSQSRDYLLALMAASGLKPTIAFRAQSYEMLRGMVANGLGVSVAYVRPLSERSYDGKRLCYRPLGDSLPAQDIVLVRHPKAQLTPTTTAVWEAVVEHCAALR